MHVHDPNTDHIHVRCIHDTCHPNTFSFELEILRFDYLKKIKIYSKNRTELQNIIIK